MQFAPETGALEASSARYQLHRPEQTLLYQIVERHYPAFVEHVAEAGKQLPAHVRQVFEGYLQCGRLEHGFLRLHARRLHSRASCPSGKPPFRSRLRCDTCHAEHLLAFSCKRRGFCPSCGALRMADGAAWLVDQVLPERPIRQWVLSFPFPLRFLLATNPTPISRVLGIVYRVIAAHLIKQAGYQQHSARTGSVTLIQRFDSALNLNIHFHMLFLDGVYVVSPNGARPRFQWVREPTFAQLTQLAHTIARRGRGAKPTKPSPAEDRTPSEQRAAMRWAQRLKRVFQVDVETCWECRGTVKIIACIEDPPVIERILNHLASKDLHGLWAESRAPPAQRA